MPAAAPLEELEQAENELQSLEMKFPETYDDFSEFFERNRSLGYSNLCKMLMREQTAKDLKGIDPESDATTE